MAKKQITAASSAADRAQAQQELYQAQLRLEAWRRSAVDGYTLVELINQAQRIASEYDYVNFGRPDTVLTNEAGVDVTVSGGVFFVNGLGRNTENFTPEQTGVDSDFAATPEPVLPPTESFVPGNNPNGPAPVDRVSNESTDFSTGSAVAQFAAAQPTATASRARDPVAVAPGAALGRNTANLTAREFGTASGFDPTTALAAAAFSTPSIGSDPNNAIPVTAPAGSGANSRGSTDDSGSVAGTGNDAIVPGTPATTDFITLTASSERDGASVSPGEPVRTAPEVNLGSNEANQSSNNIGGKVDSSGYETSPIPPVGNVLHNYANWTYSIGMYMLSVEETASICNGSPPFPPAAGLMFRSGGCNGQSLLSPGRDYYINSLRFTSVVGQNSRTTKASNNFNIEMTVTEPYGVAFLAELKNLATQRGSQSFKDISYLIEIKFKGYDNDGNPVAEIPNTTRYIPVRIINIEFKITGAGAVYDISMTPYGHAPLTDRRDSVIYEAFKVKGETYQQMIDELQSNIRILEDKRAAIEGRDPDEYVFVIHDSELASSKVGFIHRTDGNGVELTRQDWEQLVSEYTTVNSGSLLKDVINKLALATDFGAKYNTVGFPESQSSDGKPVRLVKLIPNVIIQDSWQEKAGRYKKKYIYKIETQEYFGLDVPGHPLSDPPGSRGFQKEYYWLFTGQNKDILELDLEYKFQYFYLISIGAVGEKGAVLGSPSENVLLPERSGGNDPETKPVVSVALDTIDPNTINNNYRGPGHMVASNLVDNMLNNPNGDMITADMTIIGDPDWIPQDASVLPIGESPSASGPRDRFGSIAVDTGDVFLMLKFKTPRDYREDGLMNIDTNRSYIEGLYHVLTCESEFSGGVFKQTLTLVRAMNQQRNRAGGSPGDRPVLL